MGLIVVLVILLSAQLHECTAEKTTWIEVVFLGCGPEPGPSPSGPSGAYFVLFYCVAMVFTLFLEVLRGPGARPVVGSGAEVRPEPTTYHSASDLRNPRGRPGPKMVTSR